jgi:DNA-directed RNA polymerase III subunit RPC1
LIAAIQDFITAAYLLSRKDHFFDRGSFSQLCTYIYDGEVHIDLPPPSIVKPIELWTGKQVFSVLLRPNKQSNVLVNLNVATKTYTKKKGVPEPFSMCPKDGYVVIRNSNLLSGILDKVVLGSGSNDSIFHILLRDFGFEVAADRMTRLGKICSRWLMNHGFSIGISDVWSSEEMRRKKVDIMVKAYEAVDEFIHEYNEDRLTPMPGCTPLETLESKMNKELSEIRDKAGNMCIAHLHPLNSPLVMAVCGSKGSVINISQMIACVGQQTINNTRVPDGFVNRTLPHYPLFSRGPEAKGFVKNSFFTGMTATEFFFHTMGGREGLVDTAVKTADTGYMYRRLMKVMEDLQVHYDMTVRNSENRIVQFEYGSDSMDPAELEGDDCPCDFDRLWLQYQDYKGPGLSPSQIRQELHNAIETLFKPYLPLITHGMCLSIDII